MRSLRAPSPGRRRAPHTLQLSATVLTGGMVELLMAATTSGDVPPLGRLVDHLTRLYTAAAQL